jgi:hypothetical protein
MMDEKITAEKIRELAELSREVKVLQEKMETLKSVFTEEMLDKKVDLIETEYGSLSMCRRRNYTYPEEIRISETELKEKKKEAEARGLAEYTETTFIRFDLAK